jgi:hypothetical protein
MQKISLIWIYIFSQVFQWGAYAQIITFKELENHENSIESAKSLEVNHWKFKSYSRESEGFKHVNSFLDFEFNKIAPEIFEVHLELIFKQENKEIYTIERKASIKSPKTPLTIGKNIINKDSNLKLWSHTFPQLYDISLKTTYKLDTIEITDKIGLRELRRVNNIFKINNTEPALKVICLNSDFLNENPWLITLTQLRGNHFNTILADFIPSEEFLHHTDSLGFYVFLNFDKVSTEEEKLNDFLNYSRNRPSFVGIIGEEKQERLKSFSNYSDFSGLHFSKVPENTFFRPVEFCELKKRKEDTYYRRLMQPFRLVQDSTQIENGKISKLVLQNQDKIPISNLKATYSIIDPSQKTVKDSDELKITEHKNLLLIEFTNNDIPLYNHRIKIALTLINFSPHPLNNQFFSIIDVLIPNFE